MDAAQLKVAGEQLLLHYRRSGITYLPSPRAESVKNAEVWLDTHYPEWRGLESSSLVGETATKSSSTQEIVRPPNSVAGKGAQTSAAVSANQPSNSPAPRIQGMSLGEFSSWQVGSLSVDDRNRRFEQLAREVQACRKCEDIVCRRNRTVFGVGPVDAKIVMFGEAPGADEDRVGEPFVGAAGQLLDKILIASGLKRENVYILNALKCRPPNNRTPVDVEIENCRPFFEAQLETIQPEYIVCWGAVAVRSVLKSTESVGRLRGRFHSYRGAKVMVTYHPAYLLRNADAKKLTWEDMKMLMRELGIPIRANNVR